MMKLGIYCHYKNKLYLVIGLARHSETQEILVVYIPLYEIENGNNVQIVVRPKEMFEEEIEPNIKRFTYIGEEK